MYLVFDIGGTFIKYTTMKRSGEPIDEGKFSTPYQDVEALIEKMVALYQGFPNQIKGIAISCPGTVDVNQGIVYHGGALTYLDEQPLANKLQQRCNVPVSIENDGKCAALAEKWQGSVKDYQQSVVLVLGTGVGGGIIIDGKLHRGIHLEAGEQSYVMEHYDHETGKATFVGKTCSASRMVNEIAKHKGLEKNDGEGVFQYINNQDPEAVTIFKRFCKNVAVQILNLQYIIDPEIVAIGGGISVQPALLAGIKEAIEVIKADNPLHMASPHVVTCHFRSAANLYGALYHHLLQHAK
ncbi:ROK family protein [Amphibacillus cookii]|uniref:ROK family protein n=1 Tax=Amphibacillus cookii TaxID=767787 RepID=UPI00195BE21C|nr:ROK family protein [Amphibacillus cookii]MBM7543104.1 putative NBD/HSP70 family sugar kinase [Amphibacillus cookii]